MYSIKEFVSQSVKADFNVFFSIVSKSFRKFSSLAAHRASSHKSVKINEVIFI